MDLDNHHLLHLQSIKPHNLKYYLENLLLQLHLLLVQLEQVDQEDRAEAVQEVYFVEEIKILE